MQMAHEHAKHAGESRDMNHEKNKESQRKTIELVFHNIHDHGVGIMDMWMNEIETRSGGRVRFTKSSGEDVKLIEAADVVRDVPAASNSYPLLNFIQTPFVFNNSTIGSRVVAQLYAEFAELREELSDVKVLGLGIGALMAIFSSKKWGPIRTMADFKGARTRSLPVIDDVIAALGARPVHVGYLEIGHLLATGQLDATVLGILPAHMFKLADGTAPYCTLAGDRSITMHPMRIYMKRDSWNRLPPNIQKIIEETGPAGADCWFAVHSGPDADNSLIEAMENIKKKGELIRISAEELQKWQRLIQPKLESSLNELEARGLPGRKFFNRMNELVAEYSPQN
jgi:TRAP-type C4-dicarboxylate transport system substrate-binding protein